MNIGKAVLACWLGLSGQSVGGSRVHEPLHRSVSPAGVLEIFGKCCKCAASTYLLVVGTPEPRLVIGKNKPLNAK